MILRQLMVVVVQQIERISVVGHHAQQRGRLIRRDRVPSQCVLHQAQRTAQLSQPALVGRIAADQMIAQHPGGPDAELRAATGVHAVADGEDHVQVIEIHLPHFTIGSNLCIFCTGCLGDQLSGSIDIADVPDDHSAVPFKQVGHLVCVQPDSFLFEPHIQAWSAF